MTAAAHAPRLVFQEEGHRYLLDGVEIPGNTSMLKAAGLIDDRWFTPESRDRGKEVHQACHFLCEKDLDWGTVRPDYVPYVQGFANFLLKTGFKVEANEYAIWSEHGFATTPDILGVLDGHRGVCNIKTGAISSWVGLQTAGELLATSERIYAQDEAWTWNLDPVGGSHYPTKRWALQLFPTGRWKLFPFEDPNEQEIFLGLVRLHHWKSRHGYHRTAA